MEAPVLTQHPLPRARPQASSSPHAGSHLRKDSQGGVTPTGKRAHPCLFSVLAAPHHSFQASPQPSAHKCTLSHLPWRKPLPIKSTAAQPAKPAAREGDAPSRLSYKGACVQTAPGHRVAPGHPDPPVQLACLFARKGYRTDATVSIFLGFLLFLIPAKKPCFGKKKDGERVSGDTLGLAPVT